MPKENSKLFWVLSVEPTSEGGGDGIEGGGDGVEGGGDGNGCTPNGDPYNIKK